MEFLKIEWMRCILYLEVGVYPTIVASGAARLTASIPPSAPLLLVYP